MNLSKKLTIKHKLTNKKILISSDPFSYKKKRAKKVDNLYYLELSK